MNGTKNKIHGATHNTTLGGLYGNYHPGDDSSFRECGTWNGLFASRFLWPAIWEHEASKKWNRLWRIIAGQLVVEKVCL